MVLSKPIQFILPADKTLWAGQKLGRKLAEEFKHYTLDIHIEIVMRNDQLITSSALFGLFEARYGNSKIEPQDRIRIVTSNAEHDPRMSEEFDRAWIRYREVRGNYDLS